MSALALPDGPPQSALTRYEAACQALAAAKTTDEVKNIRDRAEAMRAYARQAKNRKLEVDAAEIRMRAERRLGELITAQKKTVGLNRGGRPTTGADGEPVIADTRPTLAAAGIDKKLSARAQKLAAVPEAKFETLMVDWRERVAQETERVTAALISEKGGPYALGPGPVEWYTPDPILACARQALGEFDLDPASCAIAQTNVRARSYFTAEENGLTKEWHGRVWCNPPYCDASKFIEKLLEELGAGRVTCAIFLVNAYTETRWFQLAAAACAAICFPLGRIYFERPGDDHARQPRFGSALLYFGNQVDRFRAAFAGQGFIMLPDAGDRP